MCFDLDFDDNDAFLSFDVNDQLQLPFQQQQQEEPPPENLTFSSPNYVNPFEFSFQQNQQLAHQQCQNQIFQPQQQQQNYPNNLLLQQQQQQQQQQQLQFRLQQEAQLHAQQMQQNAWMLANQRTCDNQSSAQKLVTENDELRKIAQSLKDKFSQVTSTNTKLREQLNECRSMFRNAIFSGFENGK